MLGLLLAASVSLAQGALRLEDFRAMRPDGELEGTSSITGFVQRVPSDGQPATQTTRVYLSRDEENLYVVFVCFDEEADEVRARMLPRGVGVLDDDYVSIQLDTFRDQRRAYAFTANALGVQNTGMWVEGQGWDYSFDTVWSANGFLTEQGYVVWMSIPFRSLRFSPAAEKTWGVILQRNIPRNNEESYWPPNSSRIEGRLNQAGLLTGIEAASPGRNVQLIPHGVYRSYRLLEESGSERELGVDAKLVLKDSVVVDATLYPDFSHVESDEPQVTVNQRFEVFFPERRPFFLENASYFQTPINLLFTRRIRDPSLGIRTTGKIGPYAFGVLATDDRAGSSPARFGVVRASRDVGTQSSVGLFYSDRDDARSWNRVGGFDGRLKLSPNWTAAFQAVTSSTELPTGERVSGPAYELVLDRSGRQLNYTFEYEDRSPGFHTDVGFEPRSDVRSVHNWFRYRFRPEGERLVAWGPDIVVRRLWDHAGTVLESSAGPAVHWELPGQTAFGVYYLGSRETLRPQDLPGLRSRTTFPTSQWGIMFSSQRIPELSLSGSFASGRGVNFVPADGVVPTSEQSKHGEFSIGLRPLTSLTIDNTYLLTKLEGVFDNHIFRTKWSYQLSRSLSARVIIQYDALIANAERTRLESSRNVNVDILLKYLVNYGTALYVGYNDNQRSLDPRDPSALLNDSSQFFVKLSYLLSF